MLKTIKLSEIKLGDNPRTLFEGIDKLAGSIKELGLLTPLTVAQTNGHYTLLDGGRRYKALTKLKITDVDVVITTLDEQQQKEVPLATDFFKDKLSIGEKVAGICQLINTEQKYTPDGLVKRYGFTKQFVNTCIKLGKLDKSVVECIGCGEFGMEKAKEITRIRNVEAQKAIAGMLANEKAHSLWGALNRLYIKIPADDTFIYAQVKADPKLGFIFDGDIWCIDKKFGKEAAAGCDARMQAKYAKAKQKGSEKDTPKVLLTKDEKAVKKRKRVKAVDELAKQSTLLSQSIVTFIQDKKPSKDVIPAIIENYIDMLGSHDCKLIAKGFGHEFKISDVNTSDLRTLCRNSIEPLVKTPEQTLQFIHCIRETINPAMTADVSMFNINPLKKLIVALNK